MEITIVIPDVWTTWVLIICGWTIVLGYSLLALYLLREIVSLQYRKIDQLLTHGELYAFAVAWKKEEEKKKNG
jgi:hypothetical protein